MRSGSARDPDRSRELFDFAFRASTALESSRTALGAHTPMFETIMEGCGHVATPQSCRTKPGSDEAASVLTPGFLNLIPGFFSTQAEESVHALSSLVRMCFARALSDEEFYLMLGFNVSVPPYVRQGVFSRSFDKDDLLPKIRKPVLITQGGADAVVSQAVNDKQMNRIATAQTHLIPNAGHGCFWDDPAAYNQRLRKFVEAV